MCLWHEDDGKPANRGDPDYIPSTLYLGGQEASAWIRRGGYSGARGDATRAARGSQVSKGRGLAEADTEP
jgi:hypothetical protein